MPDRGGIYNCTDPVKFGAGVLGIARSRFRFPDETRFRKGRRPLGRQEEIFVQEYFVDFKWWYGCSKGRLCCW
jgi:hypothetical protein